MNKLKGYIAAMLLISTLSSAIWVDNQLNDSVSIQTRTLEAKASDIKEYIVRADDFAFHYYDNQKMNPDFVFKKIGIFHVVSAKYGQCVFKNRTDVVYVDEESPFAELIIKKSDNGGCEVWVQS